MPVKIITPAAGETLQTNTVPHTVTVRAIADSNINTDVRFKLNGAIVGIDTSATTINVSGTPQYQYQFNVPITTAGIQSIEAEDINQTTVPATVRSVDSLSFELKLNSPTITLTRSTTGLSPNLVTATIANRPTGSSVRFTLNGKIIKEDSQSPFNVSVPESGELKAELIVGGNAVTSTSLNVVVSTPTPTPTPIPIPPLKGDKGDKGDRGEPGPKGDTGAQGPIGLTGATGIPGAPGIKGDTGATGTPGIQGIKGDTGPKGDTGAIGPAGPAGIVWSTPISLPLSNGVTGNVTDQTCGKLVRLNVDVLMNFASSSGMQICAGMPNTIFNTWFHSTAMIFKPDLTLAGSGQWGLMRFQPNNNNLVLLFDKIVSETVRCVSNFIMPIN